ncbi:MAG: polyphosphate polymerase domain-containing protein [Candidatus Fermentibacteraceae bacterium]
MGSGEFPRLHFHRYEFKYLLRPFEEERVLAELERRMERDVHSSSQGYYYVRSHYFDSAGLVCHREKIHGHRRRHKFRLRMYSESDRFRDPLFMELKGKDDMLVYKHRMPLEAEGVAPALSAGRSAIADLVASSPGANGVADSFLFDLFRRGLSPSVVVEYRRTAFQHRADPDFRATLDTGIIARRCGQSGLPTGRPQDLASSFSVLEIKFRYRLPAWFHRLIQDLQLRRRSFSKFSEATERVYIDDPAGALDRFMERGVICRS